MIKYITIDTSEMGFVSFAELITDSVQTVRISLDATECILRYQGNMPYSLMDLQTCSEPMTHSQILLLVNSPKYLAEDLVD